MRHIIEVHEYPVITTNSPKSLSVCGFIKSQALRNLAGLEDDYNTLV